MEDQPAVKYLVQLVGMIPVISEVEIEVPTSIPESDRGEWAYKAALSEAQGPYHTDNWEFDGDVEELDVISVREAD